jgi:hypothetical protein
LSFCTTGALGGAIIFLDWVFYRHMKWINIFVSELECITSHYSINKMEEPVNLVQRPRGEKFKSSWISTHSKSFLEAVCSHSLLFIYLFLLFLYK